MKKSQDMAPDAVHSEEFLAVLMRRQWRVSAACAGAFLAVLLAIPALNYLLPEWMGQDVGGFTLSWLILGVLFFPFVWAIAWIFIRRSIRLEEEEVEWVRRGGESR